MKSPVISFQAKWNSSVPAHMFVPEARSVYASVAALYSAEP